MSFKEMMEELRKHHEESLKQNEEQQFIDRFKRLHSSYNVYSDEFLASEVTYFRKPENTIKLIKLSREGKI